MSSARYNSESSTRIGDIQAAIDAGKALAVGAANIHAVAQSTASTPLVVVPEGFRVESLLPLVPEYPRRYEHEWVLGDVESFIRAANEFKAEPRFIEGAVVERTRRMYYRIGNEPKFWIVFNDHDANGPDWCDYEASYACPLSREWRTWFGSNARQMPQVDFARFIEDNLPDVVRPSAADMLELSRTLEAKSAVNFRSGTRLQDGANELVYEQTIDATASKGKLQIPDTFDIGVPVFHNGPAYKIEARFRYRIHDSTLRLWYELVRPHKIVEHAVNELRDRIASETAMQPFLVTE